MKANGENIIYITLGYPLLVVEKLKARVEREYGVGDVRVKLGDAGEAGRVCWRV